MLSSTASIRAERGLDDLGRRDLAPGDLASRARSRSRSQSSVAHPPSTIRDDLEPAVLLLGRVRERLGLRERRLRRVLPVHVGARDRVRRRRDVVRGHLAHLRGVLQDQAELVAELRLLLVRERPRARAAPHDRCRSRPPWRGSLETGTGLAHIETPNRGSTRSARRGRAHGVPDQPDIRDRTDAAGNRRDGLGLGGHALELDVADEPHLPVSGSVTGSMPTSTAITPSRTMSPFTRPATPAATIRMSACRVNVARSARSRVAGHHRGVPLKSERRRRLPDRVRPPDDDEGLPRVERLGLPPGRPDVLVQEVEARSRRRRHETGTPLREQARRSPGARPRRPCTDRACGTRAARRCPAGSGRSTRMPVTRGSALSLPTTARTSAISSVVRAAARSRTRIRDARPAVGRAARRPQRRGSSPTRIVASPGRAPEIFSCRSSSCTCSESSSASVLPSITRPCHALPFRR